MEKIILICLIVVLSVVLALGIGYIAYRETRDPVEATQQDLHTNNGASTETSTDPTVSDEQTLGNTQGGEETTEAEESRETTKPAEATKPTETTESAGPTEPTETEGDNSGLEDNELPPM